MADREPIAEPLTHDGAPLISWAEARTRLAEARFYWAATVRADGAPHVRPVLAVWVGDALYSSTSPAAVKGRNLERDARCVVSAASEGLDLVVEGTAARVIDDAKLRRVADAYATKYEWHVMVRDSAFTAEYGAPTAGPPPYEVVYEVTPVVVFGFGTDETLAPRSTRWRFSKSQS